MFQLSRFLGIICAITIVLVSLPSSAGIGDKDLLLLNGQKTKLFYTIVGVTDGGSLATVFHCVSTERTGGNSVELGIEVFNFDGTLENDVTAGDGAVAIPPGDTYTLSTRNTAAFQDDDVVGTGTVDQGSARIFASSKSVVCSAMLVDAINTTPTSMVMLPIFRASKQRGM